MPTNVLEYLLGQYYASSDEGTIQTAMANKTFLCGVETLGAEAYMLFVANTQHTVPYIRLFYQIRNLMELIETVVSNKAQDEEIEIHLLTQEDEFKNEQQTESLEKIKAACQSVGISFTWEYDATGSLHARHITTDNGWKILLDRGLDIYQHYEMNDNFTFANRLQQFRSCKAFEVTFMRLD